MNQQMEKTKLKTKNANKCAAAGMCGGCTYINGSYEKQLTEKEQYVRTQLKGICPVNPIIGMKNPYHYRNKVTATFSYKKEPWIVNTLLLEIHLPNIEKNSHPI